MIKIEKLLWDSNFFSRKIGKIIFINPVTNINDVIDYAIVQGYQLLYIFSDYCLNEIKNNKYTLKLVDKKIVYTQKINLLDYDNIERCCNVTQEYLGNKLTYDLEQLAYLSGTYSRFKLDNNFSKEEFNRLYKEWMEKSITKKIADKIYIVRDEKKIIGFVTLKYDSNIGEIGLIAVDNSYKGKGYGKQLINMCLIDLAKKGIYTINVSTQFENKEACLFYEKCGFIIKSMTNVYHLWNFNKA